MELWEGCGWLSVHYGWWWDGSWQQTMVRGGLQHCHQKCMVSTESTEWKLRWKHDSTATRREQWKALKTHAWFFETRPPQVVCGSCPWQLFSSWPGSAEPGKEHAPWRARQPLVKWPFLALAMGIAHRNAKRKKVCCRCWYAPIRRVGPTAR